MSERIVGDDGFQLANVPHWRNCKPMRGWQHTARIDEGTRTAIDEYQCTNCPTWVRIEIGLPRVR